MIRVLFVCLGNICRSPMAEAYFRDLVKKKGLADQFDIDSAGIGNWHEGKPPYIGTRDKLDEAGISYEGMTARQIKHADLDAFDYIITMDHQNYQDVMTLREQAPTAKVFNYMDVVDGDLEEVPDPYHTGKFDETFELIELGAHQLLTDILKESK
ncbi:low molecular weight protein-tyrosine-phosphatase YfkJ [Halolactibacillus miurensis]|uniref:protein-tyrosine-phosphatase n=1 Tax=Halolactibacillus miurensis TaxID=306541 RepID=A0A1I6T955_9BACI|nr:MULTISPECIES: low molecular weight protein-tyrosine-phosphatase [Halolactibacillus]GEM04378.1 low molecular weight protein-tyrosine-phosphatase YfkJ [Halolactibacillus miurensis]SFS85754.1 protein-tyrosine phosphatase [Halolactibacillus miurensis]